MATTRDNPEPDLRHVQVAVLAKAPVAGLAKTRLIPALGPRGAARLQRQFIRRTLQTAAAARLGPVTLWCAPHAEHRFFRALHRTMGVDCQVQPGGDLGERMDAAFRLHCAQGPLLLIGTDCPALSPEQLRQAAQALCDGHDAVFGPAEDGGYVLVGLRSPQPALFSGMTWSTPAVMAETRARACAQGLRVVELETLWDVDVPADLPRLSRCRCRASKRMGTMPDRRQAIAFLALACIGVRAAPDAPRQVPALSAAALGSVVPEGWRHQTLPKVERANDFELVSDQGQHVLEVRSSASASSWVAPVRIDATRLPLLRWRWKVSHSLAGSDLRTKRADDYAARLYVFFDLPLEGLSLAERLRIRASRALSGVDVPAAALCYVWGHAQPAGSTGWNPYTDRVRMIVVDSGDTHAMQWRAVERDVRRDWLDAFGAPVPPISGVAVGADTDNTGDQVEAWFGDVSFSAGP